MRKTTSSRVSYFHSLAATDAGTAKRSGVLQIQLPNDRPPETLRMQRLVGHEDVEFWSVARSERHWAMVHDTYTTSLVSAQPGVPLLRWESRGTTHVATDGCVQLMEPGEAHRTVDVFTPVSFFVAFWRPEFLERAALELDVSGHLHWKAPQLDAGSLSRTLRVLAQALNEDDRDELRAGECLADAVRELLLGAAEGVPSRRAAGGRHHGVRRAVDLLHASFREPLSLDELAKEARLSKFHLARCFRNATGFAPHQFQKLLRVREARRLLERGTSVEETAERAGFADGPHLTRAFRETYGCSPGAFSRAFFATRSPSRGAA